MRVTPAGPTLGRWNRVRPNYLREWGVMFCFGVALTALWLVGIGTLAYFVESDILAMPLNNIGDALAGAFAPVAFLWLFVATWMQRLELSLQREELADTRKVLDEQRQELERSAAESNRQTAIMQRTLEAAQSREVYDEFRLRLYYLAKHVEDFRGIRTLHVRIPDQRNIYVMRSQSSRLFDRPNARTVSELEASSVDSVLHDMQVYLGIDFEITRDILNSEHSIDNRQFMNYVSRIILDIRSILGTAHYNSVPLIATRMQALELDILLQRLEGIQSELINALGPE